jgi:tetratricopeptide (TPR) repeat protein
MFLPPSLHKAMTISNTTSCSAAAARAADEASVGELSPSRAAAKTFADPGIWIRRVIAVGKTVLPGLVLTFLVCGKAGASRLDQTEVLLRRADVLQQQARYVEARRLLEELAHTSRANKRVYLMLADTYMAPFDAGAHDLDMAESCLKQALKCDPDFGSAYVKLCVLEVQRDQYEVAIKYANRALSVKEPDHAAVYHRAKAYAGLKQYEKALADIDSWLKSITPEGRKDPTVKDGELMMKGNMLENLKRWDDAIAVYREILPYRFDWMEFNIARCLCNQNKLPQAITEINKVIKRNPNDDEAYHLRSNLKLKNHDLQGALADSNKAIDLNPLSTYYRGRAEIYQSLGKPDLAKQDLAR